MISLGWNRSFVTPFCYVYHTIYTANLFTDGCGGLEADDTLETWIPLETSGASRSGVSTEDGSDPARKYGIIYYFTLGHFL